MPFHEALKYLLTENATLGIFLPHWGKDVCIKCQRPDENSKMTHPYLYVSSRYGMVPWMPTQVELFSEKWERIG